jgi:arylsulfatase A-like enzyme
LEFLPAIALISVLWSFFALLTTVSLWILLIILRWLCHRVALRISMEQIVLWFVYVILFGLTIWIAKILIWPDTFVSPVLKVTIFSTITAASSILTLLFRDKSAQWMNIVNERITPLVWLYLSVVLLSFLPVIYFALSNLSAKTSAQDSTEFITLDKNRPNIILITFDALTARDMSAYGYQKDTTPFIRKWAKTAYEFTRNEAASNYTAPTSSSLMTGKRVWTHRRFQSNGGKTLKSDSESIPLLLQKSGYNNIAFIANDIASVQELGMHDSFTVAPPSNVFMSPASFYGFLNKYLNRFFGGKIQLYDWILQEDFILHRVPYLKEPYRNEFPVENVINYFLSETRDKHRAPFFAWMHIFPPHFPYLPPHEFTGIFDSSHEFRTVKSQYDFTRPRDFSSEQQSNADILRARYDEFIRYCDKEFEYFIEQLERNNYLKNTVILLSADHGESFEHGYITHGGNFLYEQQTNIPLIIKIPGHTGGQIFDDLIEQIDIPATILDLAGVQVPSWVEGRSLVPLLQGGTFAQKPIFSMHLLEVPVKEKITKGIIAVWENDFKLVHDLNNNKSLLFNLKEDPDELNNLNEKEPKIVKRLLSLILDNLSKANEKIN